MKKLMFAAAAMVAGLAMADVTSANIVGYMNNDQTVAGLNLMAPGFQDVGFTSVKLTGVKVEGAEGDPTTGKCYIDVINENGFPLTTYEWKSAGRTTKTWSWYEGGSTKITDEVVFARGVGMLFSAEKAGDKLTSNGEVNFSGITFADTVAGLNVIANPYPVEIKLNTIVVEGADGDPTTGKCYIDIINENGFPLITYEWKSAGRTTKTWSWYEGGSTKITDEVTVKPGQALLFSAEKAGDKLIFPTIEL